MDTLSDVLSSMRLRGCVYFLREFAAPWGMDMPSGSAAQFHLVASGRCWLCFEGNRLELASGDVVVFPRGEAHLLVDQPETSPVPGRKVLEAHNSGQSIFANGGDVVRLLCGHFEFDRAFKHPLVGELPSLIHIKGLADSQPDWFDALARLLVRETNGELPGASVVVNRLAEVLFVQVLRAHLRRNPPVRGFLAGIEDKQVNRALKTLHASFSSELTLADVAREAGMSRASFAARFRAVVGETPMEYLTRWRMLKAQEFLRTTDSSSLADIAERVGYKSESAFSHAFKREFGHSPGAFRHIATGLTELG